jgi:hypothetical protein
LSARERLPAENAGPSPNDDEKVLIIGPSLARAHIPDLCETAQALLATNPRATTLVCDVGARPDADAVDVDALARLQLTARRFGAAFRVRNPSPRLQGLLALTGLSGVIGAAD